MLSFFSPCGAFPLYHHPPVACTSRLRSVGVFFVRAALSGCLSTHTAQRGEREKAVMIFDRHTESNPHHHTLCHPRPGTGLRSSRARAEAATLVRAALTLSTGGAPPPMLFCPPAAPHAAFLRWRIPKRPRTLVECTRKVSGGSRKRQFQWLLSAAGHRPISALCAGVGRQPDLVAPPAG